MKCHRASTTVKVLNLILDMALFACRLVVFFDFYSYDCRITGHIVIHIVRAVPVVIISFIPYQNWTGLGSCKKR